MNGPRDLRRGGKLFEPRAGRDEVVGSKSHFRVYSRDGGFLVVIQRRGHPEETEFCHSEGEMNRLRRKLSDDGLIGWMRDAR